MHWLNWYTGMCLNRLHHRTGHFWEKRYHSSGFGLSDTQRALATLRYIHGNPMATGKYRGFFYDFSNYGAYMRPERQDGITEWHPAFLKLADDLDRCVAKYRRYCQNYRPSPKPARSSHWGSRLLTGLGIKRRDPLTTLGQGTFSFLPKRCQVSNPAIDAVTRKFVVVNALSPSQTAYAALAP